MGVCYEIQHQPESAGRCFEQAYKTIDQQANDDAAKFTKGICVHEMKVLTFSVLARNNLGSVLLYEHRKSSVYPTSMVATAYN
jgi:hypothetical protein